MPIHIQEFPTELLAAVFQYLPKSTLKNARLTSTRWGDIGAGLLFERVYFAPRRDMMQRFTDITSHPVFAKTIKEVVYDGALFQSRYLNERIFKERYNAIVEPGRYEEAIGCSSCGTATWCQGKRHPVDVETSRDEQELHKAFVNDFSRYKQLQAEQEEVLSLGQDLQALCSGLKQASRVTKVSLLDYFPSPDYLPLSDVSHAWYCNYCHSNYPGVLAPSLWDNWSNMHLEDTPETYEGHDWDCRGIFHLVQAISTQCNRIQDFGLGSSVSRAPLKLLQPSTNVDSLKTIVKNLTCLQLHCGRNPRADDSILNEQLLGATSILAETPKLETLSISLSAISRRWIHIIQIPSWPQLQTLDLGDLNFTLPDLLSVIKNSQHTLRRLQLRNVWLDGGITWPTFADRLGECLRLEHVALLGLVSGISTRKMQYEETVDIAKRMMAWADQSMFEVDTMKNPIAAIVVRVAR